MSNEAIQLTDMRQATAPPVSDAVDTLILDLLQCIGPNPRPDAEVLEAWQTSCPRLPVWEDANDRGFIARHRTPGRSLLVSLSAAGAGHLRSTVNRRADGSPRSGHSCFRPRRRTCESAPSLSRRRKLRSATRPALCIGTRLTVTAWGARQLGLRLARMGAVASLDSPFSRARRALASRDYPWRRIGSKGIDRPVRRAWTELSGALSS